MATLCRNILVDNLPEAVLAGNLVGPRLAIQTVLPGHEARIRRAAHEEQRLILARQVEVWQLARHDLARRSLARSARWQHTVGDACLLNSSVTSTHLLVVQTHQPVTRLHCGSIACRLVLRSDITWCLLELPEIKDGETEVELRHVASDARVERDSAPVGGHAPSDGEAVT